MLTVETDPSVSNGLGLVPGSVVGAIGYREELRGLAGGVVRLASMSVLGALVGAVALLAAAFAAVVRVTRLAKAQ